MWDADTIASVAEAAFTGLGFAAVTWQIRTSRRDRVQGEHERQRAAGRALLIAAQGLDQALKIQRLARGGVLASGIPSTVVWSNVVAALDRATTAGINAALAGDPGLSRAAEQMGVAVAMMGEARSEGKRAEAEQAFEAAAEAVVTAMDAIGKD